MAETHTAAFLAVAFANNKSMAAIFNGVGSGRILRVYRVWVLNNQTAAVTGVLTTFSLRRSTAQSSGTAVTPVKHDTASANLPAQVLVATNATVTSATADTLRNFVWSNDEPAVSSGTSDEFECVVPLNCIWDSDPSSSSNVEPITLREGFGLDVRHSGSSAVGVCDIFIEFTSV